MPHRPNPPFLAISPLFFSSYLLLRLGSCIERCIINYTVGRFIEKLQPIGTETSIRSATAQFTKGGPPGFRRFAIPED